ncbi:MAG TPA: SDR family NAD(P)-dependent oxidoreductase [Candidatus Pacearchaeota archaeon]|nr:SDR family oxidoreductase [Candidatus Parcubacteria bacterium]HNP79433.1 SDR family NAD(P)-dependent oxidoreductase [Candidatus Pacearchaeota archaeon]HOC53590.1 SDR family NAD(P)-dependent oxidoreductase [Candidatus Pacearchaeota archaeon]HQM24650.1 SDR family NAD(P)-dependent oxidoreductase [Candidatus Pacearchaeota archaeon]
MKLENKVAIVTGACSGIGKAIAEEFLEQGASVVFSDINEIKINSEKAMFIKCDVSKSEEVNNLIEETAKKFGRIDIMVNNAGIGTVGDTLSADDDCWNKIIGINLSGVFFGMRAAGNKMKELGIKGSIINMTSILGTVGFRGAIGYCAAKGGVNQLTKAGALDLASCGIRVNAIAPGFIKTQMTKGVQEDEKLKAFIESKTPLGYMGEPMDIAKGAAYLASEDSKYVTGNILYIDGGWISE